MAISDYSTSAGSNVTIAGINVGEGMARADVNGAIRQLMADTAVAIGNATLGALPAGTTLSFVVTKSASGSSGGTTNWRPETHITTYTGGFGAQQVSNINFQHNLMHTSGTVSFAYGIQGYSALGTPSVATPTGDVSTLRGIDWHISHTGNGNVGDAFAIFSSGPDLDVGTGLIVTYNGFRSGDISGGTGTNRITGATYGFFQANSSVVNTPIQAAYGSEMSSGANRWNLYLSGGANNCIVGLTRIGDTNVPVDRLEVANGNIKIETGGFLKIGADRVVTGRLAALPADATDLASAITLLNAIKARLKATGGHGLVAD